MATLDDLRRIRDDARKTMALREAGERAQIVVAMGTCGIAAGARAVVKAILDELGQRQATNVTVTQSDCKGQCASEPMLDVQRPGEHKVTYGHVTPDVARRIVAQHVIGGQPLAEYIIA